MRRRNAAALATVRGPDMFADYTVASDAVRFTVIQMQFVVPHAYDDATGLPDGLAKPVPTPFIGVSDPRPIVVLDEVRDSDVTIGAEFATVSLNGYVSDPIADNIPRGTVSQGLADIDTVSVYVNGELDGDYNIVSYDDALPSFWRQHPYKGSFTIPSVAIPLVEGTHIIRVQTSENAAGNIGYDEIAVSLEKRVIPGSTPGGGTDVTVNITFPAEPSLEAVNILYPTRSGITIRRRYVCRPDDHQQILLEHLGLTLPRQLKVIDREYESSGFFALSVTKVG